MMKSILTTIVFLVLVVSGLAQTRSVIVNTSGVVQSPTNFWNVAGTVGLASNVTGTIAISNGGSGATTAGGARTNLGLGATNSVSFSNISATGYISMGTSVPLLKSEAAGVVGFYDSVDDEYILSMSSDSDDVIINSQWNNAGVRSNLGLGASWLTNTNVTNFRTAIGLGTTNTVAFDTIQIQSDIFTPALEASDGTNYVILTAAEISFQGVAGPQTRTNLGLGWSALTNTNPAGFNTSLYGSGTNPVLYNTNGEVVSPTNFWQVAPIVTRFVESQPIASQTTNITAARNLHIHSIAISTTNVTNTIALPTTNSFDGDIALVVHQGPTSSVTAVRTAGAATNLVTMNRPEEAVEFVYYNNVWQFNHNQSFIEPIYFSGTNATANAAASRTNLGLGNTNNVTFQQVTVNGNIIDGSGFFYSGDINVGLSLEEAWIQDFSSNRVLDWGSSTNLEVGRPINFGTNVATTRANLNLGAADNVTFSNITANGIVNAKNATSGTPTNATNARGIQWSGLSSEHAAIYGTYDGVAKIGLSVGTSNSLSDVASFRATGMTVASNAVIGGTLTATSTITAKTNMVVEGFVDFTTNRTNNNPASGANFSDRSRWLQVKIGTNNFYIPLFQ